MIKNLYRVLPPLFKRRYSGAFSVSWLTLASLCFVSPCPQMIHTLSFNSHSSSTACNLSKFSSLSWATDNRLTLFFISQIRAQTFKNCMPFSGFLVTACVDHVRPDSPGELFPRTCFSPQCLCVLATFAYCLENTVRFQIKQRTFPGSHFFHAFLTPT